MANPQERNQNQDRDQQRNIPGGMQGNADRDQDRPDKSSGDMKQNRKGPNVQTDTDLDQNAPGGSSTSNTKRDEHSTH